MKKSHDMQQRKRGSRASVGDSGVRYASLSKSFKPYHTAGLSAKAAASLLMSISSCMLTAQHKPMIVKIVLVMLWRI
jgi:hypothetical protein